MIRNRIFYDMSNRINTLEEWSTFPEFDTLVFVNLGERTYINRLMRVDMEEGRVITCGQNRGGELRPYSYSPTRCARLMQEEAAKLSLLVSKVAEFTREEYDKALPELNENIKANGGVATPYVQTMRDLRRGFNLEYSTSVGFDWATSTISYGGILDATNPTERDNTNTS